MNLQHVMNKESFYYKSSFVEIASTKLLFSQEFSAFELTHLRVHTLLGWLKNDQKMV